MYNVVTMNKLNSARRAQIVQALCEGNSIRSTSRMTGTAVNTHYNFARPHKTLSKPYATTPAMAAGLTDHVWEIGEIVALLERPN